MGQVEETKFHSFHLDIICDEEKKKKIDKNEALYRDRILGIHGNQTKEIHF